MNPPFQSSGSHPHPRTQHVRLARRCPVCGGRSHADAKLPLSQGIRTLELNLDEPAHLVETLSLHLLLALVELLPYKQFACQRCGHEFKLTNQTTRSMVYSLLTSMEPVAAAKPPPLPSDKAKPATKARPASEPALGEPVAPAPRPRPKTAPKPTGPAAPAPKRGGPDWTPYHLDQGMDALFDQFKEE